MEYIGFRTSPEKAIEILENLDLDLDFLQVKNNIASFGIQTESPKEFENQFTDNKGGELIYDIECRELIIEMNTGEYSNIPFMHPSGAKVVRMKSWESYSSKDELISYLAAWDLSGEKSGYSHSGSDWTCGHEFEVTGLIPVIDKRKIEMYCTDKKLVPAIKNKFPKRKIILVGENQGYSMYNHPVYEVVTLTSGDVTRSEVGKVFSKECDNKIGSTGRHGLFYNPYITKWCKVD